MLAQLTINLIDRDGIVTVAPVTLEVVERFGKTGERVVFIEFVVLGAGQSSRFIENAIALGNHYAASW